MAHRSSIFSILLGVGLGLGGIQTVAPLQAQDMVQNPNVILTIDQDVLFTKSLFGERVTSEIRADLKALEKEFQNIEAALTAEEKDLTQKRSTLTPDDFRILADAFDEKVQGIRKAQDARARGLDRQLDEQRNRYYGLINPILREVMAELGGVVILDRRVILVGGENVDITKLALQRIDARLGDGATPPDPADPDPTDK